MTVGSSQRENVRTTRARGTAWRAEIEVVTTVRAKEGKGRDGAYVKS